MHDSYKTHFCARTVVTPAQPRRRFWAPAEAAGARRARPPCPLYALRLSRVAGAKMWRYFSGTRTAYTAYSCILDLGIPS